MIHAAILGNGGIARAHRGAYRELIEAGVPIQLDAVCDIRPERREDADGARAYADFDEMLRAEKELDYVDICLPTFLHAEYAMRAMRAGLNVMSEKPMALTAAEAEEMAACARETGKTLMIGQCMRFFEPMQIIKRYIDEKPLGRPLSAYFTRLDGQPKGSWNDWFLDGEKSGGCILDLQIHDIDVVNWFFGMPKSVSVAAAEVHPGHGYESISANSFYENGLFVHNATDWNMEKNRFLGRTVRVNFENGYIYHERGSRNVFVAVDHEGNETDLSAELKMPKNMYRNELEYFINCLIKGEKPAFSMPEESAKAVKIVEAQRRSADAQGERVNLEP